MKKQVNTAVILAAGMGKRLDAFETPKPLLKVGGKQLVRHALDMIKDAGIENVYVVTKKGDNFFKKELSDYPLNVTFVEQLSDERGMLDSVLSVSEAVSEPCIVSVCDLILSENPYKAFIKAISDTDELAALVSTKSEHNELSGANVKVYFDDREISEFGDQVKTANGYDMGIYYISGPAFDKLKSINKDKESITSVPELFSAYSTQHGSIKPVEFSGDEWFDINDPHTFIRAELYLQNKVEGKPSEKVKELKTLPRTIGLHNTKQTITDIVVQRDVIKNLSEYEIIPPERYHSPHHLIVDSFLENTYGESIYKDLKKLGYKIFKYSIPPGETAKSITGYVELADKIIKNGLDKKSVVISVGGGATKDMAGFIASTLYRGIGFISFPTTILSQCDAAIALKQGVNGIDGKNLIGSWYAPLKIIVDPAVSQTLDDRYIRDGLAECIKQAFAYDRELYDIFDAYDGDLKDLDFLEKVMHRSITDKVVTIEEDIHEDKVALVNQYGHEFGHAVEHLSGYAFGHGESVAIGMRVSAELSHILGICDKDVVEAHKKMLKKYGLPYQVPKNISPESILDSLKYNKKYYSGEPRFVLVDTIGSVWHDETYYTVYCRDQFIKEAIENSYD